MPRQHTHQRGGIGLWLLLLVLLAGAVIGGALAALWVFSNVDARLVLADQHATVTTTEPFEVSARVTDRLRIRIDEHITTSVPVDVPLSLPVRDTLDIRAEFDAQVPIEMEVEVRDEIEIDQLIELDAVVDAFVLGDWHKLPIRGRIPVRATVPVNLLIPVDEVVHLQFTAPVRARILDNLNVPLQTVINTTIPIQSEMNVPLLSDLHGVVRMPPDKPLHVLINYADLQLPLRTLKLGLGGEEESEK